MNHIKKIALLFLGITLIFSSCKKDEKLNQTQSEDFYKEKLEKMFPQKGISSINERQQNTKTVLTFNSHAEAYEVLSSLKNGVTFVDSVKAVRSLGDTKNANDFRRTNFGDDPVVIIENLSAGGQVSTALKNSYHTIASNVNCSFTVRYTSLGDGYGSGWAGEIFNVKGSHSPLYITSGVGQVIGQSGSYSWNGALSTYDGVTVKIIGLNGTETQFPVTVKLSVYITAGFGPGSFCDVTFRMVTTS